MWFEHAQHIGCGDGHTTGCRALDDTRHLWASRLSTTTRVLSLPWSSGISTTYEDTVDAPFGRFYAIRQGGGHRWVELTDFANADFIFSHAYPATAARLSSCGRHALVNNVWIAVNSAPGSWAISNTWFDGVVIEVLTVMHYGKLILTYISPRQTNLCHSRRYRGVISLSQAGVSGYRYDDVTALSTPFCSMYPRSITISIPSFTYDEIIAIAKELPTEKITQDHHMHYTPVMIVQHLYAEHQYLIHTYVQLMNRITGFSAAGWAGILLWLCSLPEPYALLFLESDVFEVATSTEWYAKAKRTSFVFKHCANVVPADLSPFYEFEVLINRVHANVDWAAEKLHRTRPTLANIPHEYVYNTASDIFGRARIVGATYKTKTWDQFWSNRWEWATTGAVYNQHPFLEEHIKVKSRFLKNKFIALNMLPNDLKLEQLLDTQPSIAARPSPKYEWGKVRAIYGTDLLSYILFEFVFSDIEEHFTPDIPIGASASERQVGKLVDSVSQQGYSYCLDYEDFNSQHSTESMVQVLLAYVNTHCGRMSEDQISASRWCLQALYNQYVDGRNCTGGQYKAVGTLFSGWRLTTVVNTALNCIYTRYLVDSSGAETYGSLHSGDDVLMYVKTPRDAQLMIRAAVNCGVRLSVNKCALGSISEFLRVDRFGGTNKQYLARNISTVIHGRTESQQHGDLVEAMKSNETRLDEYLSRGGRPSVHVALEKAYKYRLSVSESFGKPSFDLIDSIKARHPVYGGINHKSDVVCDDAVTYTSSLLREEEYNENMPGVQAYIKNLVHLLPNNSLISKLHGAINNATRRVVYSIKRRVDKITPVVGSERQVMHSLYKLYSNFKYQSKFGKARLVGLDVVNRNLSGSINHIMNVIGDKENFYEWLSMLV